MSTFEQDGLTYHKRTLNTRGDMADEARANLYDHIIFDMKEKDAREWLAVIANIFDGSDPPEAKYADISDCFESMIDKLAQAKWEALIDD